MSVANQVFIRTLGTVAIALVCWVGGAAPAGADPNTAGTEPNPFGGLSCSCPAAAPPGSQAEREGLDHRFRSGLAGG